MNLLKPENNNSNNNTSSNILDTLNNTLNKYPILALHGLTARSSQLSPLKEYLELNNVNCFTPHIIGHRNGIPTPSDVPIHAIELELAGYIKYLKKKPENKIIILGQSMGALLAINLAAKFPDDIKGLILISPGLKLISSFQNSFNNFMSYVPFFITRQLGVIKKKWVSKKHENKETAYPITLLKHLGSLQKKCLSDLEKLKTNIVIIQNKNDYHLDPEISSIIQKSSPQSKFKTHLGDWQDNHSLAHIKEVHDIVLSSYNAIIKDEF